MNNATVIINAAGCGSRLGMKLPKSLVKVAGRSMLEWQLGEMCPSVQGVRIVVGYLGERVAELARHLRPSIEVIVNENWKTTKTAASLSLGMEGVAGRCVSLDGDLLVHPDDFRELLLIDHDMIGITEVNSSQPVFAVVDEQGRCSEMSYTKLSPYEWTGLVNFWPKYVAAGQGNVFEMIECLLPAPTMKVRCCEIDTPADLLNAARVWPQYTQWMESDDAARYVG